MSVTLTFGIFLIDFSIFSFEVLSKITIELSILNFFIQANFFHLFMYSETYLFQFSFYLYASLSFYFSWISFMRFKGQNISKGIIHDNDVTHQNECVLKIDPKVKFLSIFADDLELHFGLSEKL